MTLSSSTRRTWPREFKSRYEPSLNVMSMTQSPWKHSGCGCPPSRRWSQGVECLTRIYFGNFILPPCNLIIGSHRHMGCVQCGDDHPHIIATFPGKRTTMRPISGGDSRQIQSTMWRRNAIVYTPPHRHMQYYSCFPATAQGTVLPCLGSLMKRGSLLRTCET